MVVDSNILIYAINADSPKHEISKKFLNENISKIAITHQNILETIRVLTHNKFSNPMKVKEALLSIKKISEVLNIVSPDQTTIHITLDLIEEHNLSGNRIFDAYLVATAFSNGDYEIATDNIKDFQKFKGLKVINPY